MNKKEALEKIEELKAFVENCDKEIGWTKIGDLEWSDNLGEMNWNESMAKAKELGARLPERWEMIKAVDENYEELQELIENDPSNFFWSATEYSATNAWYVYLYNGSTNFFNKSTASYQVRCVR